MTLRNEAAPVETVRTPEITHTVAKSRHSPKKRTAMLVATLWLACSALSLLSGPDSFIWFLRDYAAQSRILLVLPLVMIASPQLQERLLALANRFREAGLVSKDDWPGVEDCIRRMQEQRASRLTNFVIAVISLVVAVSAIRQLQDVAALLPWAQGPGGEGLSATGFLYGLLVIPTIAFFLLRWVWLQVLWMRFVSKVSRRKLRLIAAHPDNMGGLSFLESSQWEYYPYGFAIGLLFSGGIANRVLYFDAPLHTFKYVAVVPVLFILAICILPLCLLFFPMLKAKHDALFEYGKISLSAGRFFEARWLAQTNWDDSTMTAQDMAGAKNYALIVSNVYRMKSLPFSSKTIIQLAIWTLVPMIPLLLIAVPVEVLARQIFKILF